MAIAGREWRKEAGTGAGGRGVEDVGQNDEGMVDMAIVWWGRQRWELQLRREQLLLRVGA